MERKLWIKTPTPHNEAKLGQIAKTVLLPGDPLRAKWIAEKYFETDCKQYNWVRNMNGYTGTNPYAKKLWSAQGSGMGMGSLSIYATELIGGYGVERIIRVGSAGGMQKNLNVGDIVFASTACTDSAMNMHRFKGMTYAACATASLLRKAQDVAIEQKIQTVTGPILSGDIYYDEDENWKKFAPYGVLCAEMETTELYTLGARHGIEVLSILTISNIIGSEEEMSPQERETGFNKMMEIAIRL